MAQNSHKYQIMKKSVFYLFLIVFWSLLAETSQGRDTRILTQPNEFPAVGRIYAEIDGTVLKISNAFSKDLQQIIRDSREQNKPLQYNFCTATLIPQDLILTAAHCYEQIAGYNSHKIKTYFQPSLRGSAPTLVSTLQILKFGKLFNRERLKDDWAIIKLDETIPNIKPLRFFQINENEKSRVTMQAVGYPHKVRNENPSGHLQYKTNCNFIKTLDLQTVFGSEVNTRAYGSEYLNCFVSVGNSGGPLIHQLRIGNSYEPVIVGVLVAGTGFDVFSQLLNLLNLNTKPQVSFAAPVDQILEALVK